MNEFSKLKITTKPGVKIVGFTNDLQFELNGVVLAGIKSLRIGVDPNAVLEATLGLYLSELEVDTSALVEVKELLDE